MKIRQGKDITLRWKITTNGEALPLEGRNLTLVLSTPNGRERVLSYTTEGDTISTRLFGKEITHLGDYTLTLWENRGEQGQTAVDAVNAFELVKYTTMEEDGSPCGNLEAEVLNLSGELGVFQQGTTTEKNEQVDMNTEDIAELQQDMKDVQATKQDALISGQNIKTINGKDILGGGNIEIEAGITEEEKAEINAKIEGKADIADVEELAQELATKAPKSGYAPDLKVNFAKELVGRGEATPEVIGGIRPTGVRSIGDGNATIAKIKGNSVVWNQGAANPRSISDCTITFQDGVYMITPKAEGRTQVGIRYLDKLISNALSLTHTYLCTANVRCTNTNDVVLGQINASGNVRDKHYVSKTCSTTWQKISFIWKEGTASDGYYASSIKYTANDVSDVLYVRDWCIHDLTLMFGAGNEPTTIEDFEARKPLNVSNEYNEGTIVSYDGDALKSVGFNAWDEEWEVGKINQLNGANEENNAFKRSVNYTKLIKNTKYYCSYTNGTSDSVWIMFFDLNGNPIEHKVGGIQVNNLSNVKNTSFVTPNQDCKVRFYAKNEPDSQVCIHLAHTYNPERYPNGYAPYEADIHPLPDVTSILDAEGNQLFPYGLLSAGSVYDEITATKAIKRVDKRAYAEGDEANASVLTDGTSTLYALATPIEVDLLEELNMTYEAWDFGTEELIADSATTPLNAEIVYQFNAVDRIRENSSAIDALEEHDEKRKDDGIKLLDNGNLELTLKGETREFMPATPSGDPMHWAYVSAGAEYNATDEYILKKAPWKDMVDTIEDKATWGLDVVDASKVKQMTIGGVVYNYATENRTSPEGGTYDRYFLVGQSNGIWVEDETKVLHLPKCWYLNGLGDITNAEMRRIVENKFIVSVWEKKRAIQSIKARTLLNPYTLQYTDGIGIIANLYDVKIESFTLSINNFKIVSLEYCIPMGIVAGNQKNLKYIACTKDIKNITHNNVRVLPINKLVASVNISSPVISKESIIQNILNATPTSAITITLHHDAYARLAEDADIVAALAAKPLVTLVSA